MQKILTQLKNDKLFTQVMRSSSALFSANSISLGLSILQGVLITRLLGPDVFGLVKVIMVYASTINSIFSFRMSELVVRYGGEYIEKNEKGKASALIKAAGITEASVSLLAFLLVILTANWAETHIAKTSGIAWMFTIYAIGLLANFNTETSTGILQVTGKIKQQGLINLIQSVITSIIVVIAYLAGSSLEVVLIAYLAGKIILGLGLFLAAQIQLGKILGTGWWQTKISALTSARELIRFAISSNISATIIKVFRESELLWVAYFLTTTEAGYYSVAYTIANFLTIPADPLIAATFPEINSLAIQKSWGKLKDFLRKITIFAFAYNLALGLAFIFLGHWLIIIYAGEQFTNAYSALVALTIGLVFNYTLFWNRPLLLSLGLPQFPIAVTLIAGILKLGLTLPLLPRYGIVAAGALLSFYYVASVGAMVWRGLQEIHLREQ